MGRDKITVDTRILEFVKDVKKHLNIDRIILFGSRARDEALKGSDYDFVVVSLDFEGVFSPTALKCFIATGTYPKH